MNRRLLLLGAALILTGLAGLLPRLAPEGVATIPQLLTGMLVVGAGLSALRFAGRPLLWTCLVAITAILLFGFVEMFRNMSNLKSYGFFMVCNIFLMELGAPILWGSAKARRAEPGSLPAQKAGRLSAGAVQLGFVFMFAAEVHRFSQFPFFDQSQSPGAAALDALMRLSEVAERILLLWAAIESVRTAVDDEGIARRAARIDRLMGGWLFVGALHAILSHGHALVLSMGSASVLTTYVWRSAALLLLSYGGALAVSNRLAVRNAGPDTVATGNPLSGAEA